MRDGPAEAHRGPIDLGGGGGVRVGAQVREHRQRYGVRNEESKEPVLDVVQRRRAARQGIERRQLNEIAGENGFAREHGYDDAEPCAQAETRRR